MAIMDVLHWLNQNHLASVSGMNSSIIPMVLIPLTALTVAITSIASIIAGWFGIKLHTEGPKQLLEVLLKKRVLFAALLFNLSSIGIYKTYTYINTHSSFLATIKYHSNQIALASDEIYPDSKTRSHDYIGKINTAHAPKLNLVWKKSFKKGPFRSGVISNQSIFYGMDDGYVYEINKKDGSTKRKFFIGSQVSTRPVIYNQKLFAGEGNHETHHARIYSFDLQTGKFINAFQTKGHTEGQVNIASFNKENLLFIVSGKDGIYAVNPDNMKKKWHVFDGHIDATVTVEKNIVYAGSGKEKGNNIDRSYATAYDFSNGKTLWKKELPISNWMHPIVTSSDVCYALGEIYFPSDVGFLYCINKINGAPHFSIPFDAPIAGKPFYIKSDSEEMIFTTDLKGTVCAVDLKLKEKKWCQQTGTSKTDYSLSSVDFDSKRGIIWYASFDNGLYAFHPHTGEILLHWLPDNKDKAWGDTYASVTIDDDFIYTADIDGTIRKFEIK